MPRRKKDDQPDMSPHVHKWRCPKCGRWVLEELARCCKECKKKQSRTPELNVQEAALW